MLALAQQATPLKLSPRPVMSRHRRRQTALRDLPPPHWLRTRLAPLALVARLQEAEFPNRTPRLAGTFAHPGQAQAQLGFPQRPCLLRCSRLSMHHWRLTGPLPSRAMQLLAGFLAPREPVDPVQQETAAPKEARHWLAPQQRYPLSHVQAFSQACRIPSERLRPRSPSLSPPLSPSRRFSIRAPDCARPHATEPGLALIRAYASAIF